MCKTSSYKVSTVYKSEGKKYQHEKTNNIIYILNNNKKKKKKKRKNSVSINLLQVN